MDATVNDGEHKGCFKFPSEVPRQTLPISSYIGISAGPVRSPRASAASEHLLLRAQPCQRATPRNSDRNRSCALPGSGEDSAPLKIKGAKGEEVRLAAPPGFRPGSVLPPPAESKHRQPETPRSVAAGAVLENLKRLPGGEGGEGAGDREGLLGSNCTRKILK